MSTPLRRRVLRPAALVSGSLAVVLGWGTVAAPAAPAAPAVDRAAVVNAVTFEDNFDGPGGTAVDPGKWQIETGDNVNNHERQWYTPGAANAALDGLGNLVITARRENPGTHQCWYGRCEYTSARLNTAGRFTQKYGHVEARMKVPRGQGMWPAFWMLGEDIGQVGWPNSGEIDVMENVGFEPSTVHGTLHGPGYSGAGGIGAAYTLSGGRAFADDFHTFAVDWAPGSITWSVDGQVYQRRTPADLGGQQWAFDKPFFLILNLAVGGDWPGDPDGSTQFPSRLVVDYVRVSTADSGGGRTGTFVGLAGKCLDVAGAQSTNGTQVQLYTCNGTAAQRWTLPGDGTVRALGKCLDVNEASTAPGAKVQLWDCNGTGAQRFDYNGTTRDLVNIPADKCVDVREQNPADSTPVQTWSCSGNANQKWTFTG
ncbi:glycoside hydrolase family 16 protein [Streptomyces sp. RerS4]|uniref:glycoside hydrolase family 16 protein n=1 Tax=Streptomyces sp. RerS4 TaxID=2942449 RepID=UPI00201BD25F|nr:glycoside hydrolase family 16 protein [Streptomyces sp. RerS4]UQX03704.1 family 16 glycosylhydrolase [Streptomyces sp. RerS4]